MAHVCVSKTDEKLDHEKGRIEKEFLKTPLLLKKKKNYKMSRGPSSNSWENKFRP
jgi:hypothetical protein